MNNLFGQGKTNIQVNQIKFRSTGVIIPPPETRNLIDKTAEYVAESGPDFENLLLSSEARNPKFDFLKNNHPYRSYYIQKVDEFRNRKCFSFPQEYHQDTSIHEEEVISELEHMGIQEDSNEEESIEVQKALGPINLEILKHTAQYVARHGESFLIKLSEKEKQNPEFDFLKPTHKAFSYFANLVAGYLEVVNPSINQLDKLHTNVISSKLILEAAYSKFEEELKRRRNSRNFEATFQSSNEADWENFIIVETINLGDGPTNLEEQLQMNQEDQNLYSEY